MSKGIRLSKKHGVNPTMVICAWCHEQTGEIALVGELPGDIEAPREMIVSYEPCDKCREKWDQGVACVEVDTKPTAINQPPIHEDLYPTGRCIVVNSERLKGVFDKDFHDGDRCLVEADMFEQVFGHIFSNGGNLQ